MRCIVPNCSNDSSAFLGISFNKFPTMPSLRKAFVAALCKEGWQPAGSGVVCSDHSLAINLSASGVRSLQLNSVPIVQTQIKIEPMDEDQSSQPCYLDNVHDHTEQHVIKIEYDQENICTDGQELTDSAILPANVDIKMETCDISRRNIPKIEGNTIEVPTSLDYKIDVSDINVERDSNMNRQKCVFQNDIIVEIHPGMHGNGLINHNIKAEKEIELYQSHVKVEDTDKVNEICVTAWTGENCYPCVSQPGVKRPDRSTTVSRGIEMATAVSQNSQQMKLHKSNTGVAKTKKLSCDVCPYQTKCNSKLLNHTKAHAASKSFHCNICHFRTIRKQTLQRHAVLHSGERPHSCRICKKSFAQKANLDSHLKTHSNYKPLACKYCSKEYGTRNGLNKHLKIHSGDKAYTCYVCDKRFMDKIKRRKHLRIHYGDKPYSCDVCEKAFAQRRYLIQHLRVHSGKQYSCEMCKKAFYAEKNLQIHLKTHGEKPVDTTDKAFNKGSLEMVMRSQPGRRIYPCNMCNKAFNDENYLQMHLRIHEKRYTCDHCSKTFNHRPSLITHLRAHTGEKAYSCEICKKVFYSKQNLQSHLIIHSGDKPFVCNVCRKAFNKQGSLKIHSRTHTGEKPYLCNICKRAFSTQGGLQNHLGTHSG